MKNIICFIFGHNFRIASNSEDSWLLCSRCKHDEDIPEDKLEEAYEKMRNMDYTWNNRVSFPVLLISVSISVLNVLSTLNIFVNGGNIVTGYINLFISVSIFVWLFKKNLDEEREGFLI